ncbi:MAG: vitamin K epoxide reductase family protein [Fimbriimonadales bacterium]
MRGVWINRFLLLLAFAGIFVAGVLSLSHLMGLQVPCGESQGCFTVQNHPSSKWFGIPVAYFGLGGYVMLAALGFMRALKGVFASRALVMASLFVSGIGTIVSVVLTVYALTVIQATCIWCLTSAGIMTVSFLFSAILAQADPVEGAKESFVFPALLAVIAIGALGFQAKTLKEQSTKMDIKLDNLAEMSYETLAPKDAPSLGSYDAPVTIVEFADLTCPMCKDSYVSMRDEFVKYKGKLRWVFRHFPLLYKGEQHQFALPAALIAEVMLEKGKVWPYLDAVFSLDQKEIKSADPFFEIATSLGFERREIELRITNDKDKAVARFYQDLEVANKLGVSETPTFFVIPRGEKPIPANVNMIKAILDSPEIQAKLGGASGG